MSANTKTEKPARRDLVRATLAFSTLAVPGFAADAMHLLASEPRPDQVMSGTGVAFALHFDHPLDHQASRFKLRSPDGAMRTVPVRLGAQPSVLYGSVGRLSPGDYVLDWSARAADGGRLSGTLPFTVHAAKDG